MLVTGIDDWSLLYQNKFPILRGEVFVGSFDCARVS